MNHDELAFEPIHALARRLRDRTMTASALLDLYLDRIRRFDPQLHALRSIAPAADVKVGSGRWEDDPYQSLNLRGALDISRAREDLGYEPRYALEDGLGAYIAWWRAVAERSGTTAVPVSSH